MAVALTAVLATSDGRSKKEGIPEDGVIGEDGVIDVVGREGVEGGKLSKDLHQVLQEIDSARTAGMPAKTQHLAMRGQHLS